MLSPTTTLPTPTTPSDWNNIQFRLDGALVDSGSYLSGFSFANADVAFSVAYCYDRTESRPFPGIRLLLNESDPENLLLKVGEERVNDLGFHYPQSLRKYLGQGDYLPLLDELA